MAVFLQCTHERAHRIQIFPIRRARPLLNLLQSHRARIFQKRVNVLIGVLTQWHARLVRAGNGAIVHVGEVHHLPHAVALEIFQRAPQHVHAHERPEVADVAPRIDREAAGVHPHQVILRRCELLFPACECVVEIHEPTTRTKHQEP